MLVDGVKVTFLRRKPLQCFEDPQGGCCRCCEAVRGGVEVPYPVSKELGRRCGSGIEEGRTVDFQSEDESYVREYDISS